jgi:hypothetical protein
MTKDIHIFESGNGGELAIVNQDVFLVETLYQQAYLALFGGNIEANTSSTIATEEKFDYWGNNLFWGNIPSKQFNSNTQRVLRDAVLNSVGRLQIITAVTQDLAYLSQLANIDVDVVIISTNRIQIDITFTRRTNQQSQIFQLVYDNANNEIITQSVI